MGNLLIVMAATIDLMEAKLLLIPWLVSVVYSSVPLFWFAVHPFAPRWRKWHRSPYWILLPTWLFFIALVSWLSWPWRGLRMYATLWSLVPAVVLLVIGSTVYREVAKEFSGRKLSGEAEVRSGAGESHLVTTGLHARMRHPIYLAHLINLAGWTAGSGLLVCYVLFAVSAILTFPLLVWMEDKELEKRFGQQYRDYKSRVGLLPWPTTGTQARSIAL